MDEEKRFYEIQIEALHEYRINYTQKYKINLEIKLKEGTAEIFGKELSKYKELVILPGNNFFIFTYEGCKIQLNQNPSQYPSDFYDPEQIYYDSQSQDMIILANISLFLSELRQSAQQKLQPGPNVLICGGQNKGKNTIAKILINYACKQGWQPIFSDLDISKNEILSGGIMGACQCKYQYPEDFMSEQQKILFFHGSTNLDIENFQNELYQYQVKQLANGVKQKINYDLDSYKNQFAKNISEQHKEMFISDEKKVFASGCIYNIPYFPAGENDQKNELIQYMIKCLDADVIIVVEEDNLFRDLNGNQFLSHKQILYVRLGAVSRQSSSEERNKFINKQNNNSLSNYFSGKNLEIESTTRQIPYDKIILYQIITEKAQTHMNNIEFSLRAERLQFEKAFIGKSVIGILHCKLSEAEEKNVELATKKILSSPLCILAHIDQINEEKKEMTVLFPFNENQEQYLPQNKVWVIGSLTWTRIQK